MKGKMFCIVFIVLISLGSCTDIQVICNNIIDKADNKVEQITAKQLIKLEECAKSGDIESQYIIGRTYYRGNPELIDTTKANFWLTKALNNGHPKAQEDLKFMPWEKYRRK